MHSALYSIRMQKVLWSHNFRVHIIYYIYAPEYYMLQSTYYMLQSIICSRVLYYMLQSIIYPGASLPHGVMHGVCPGEATKHNPVPIYDLTDST